MLFIICVRFPLLLLRHMMVIYTYKVFDRILPCQGCNKSAKCRVYIVVKSNWTALMNIAKEITKKKLKSYDDGRLTILYTFAYVLSTQLSASYIVFPFVRVISSLSHDIEIFMYISNVNFCFFFFQRQICDGTSMPWSIKWQAMGSQISEKTSSCTRAESWGVARGRGAGRWSSLCSPCLPSSGLRNEHRYGARSWTVSIRLFLL